MNALPPLDRTELVVAQVRIEEADRSARLRKPVVDVRIERVATVAEIFDRNRMLLVDAYGERRVDARDVVVAAAIGGRHAAHEILASRDVERRPLAEDRAQR